MPDFSSVGSVQRYLAALEEQKRLEQEKARAAQFNVNFGGLTVQGPQARPVQGPQPRPTAAPAPQPIYSFTPPAQPVGPQPRPVQGPAARPEPSPWQSALDSWQSGPPREETPVNIPVTYDVQSTLPSISYGYDRPDTGPTGLDTVQSFNPSTVNADQVGGYDPYAPQMPNAWGVSRFGGGGMAIANAALPMAAGQMVGAVMGPMVGAGMKAAGNTIWDAYKSAVYGDPNEAAAGDQAQSGEAWNPLGGDNLWAQSAGAIGDWFMNSAAKERFDADVTERAAERQRVGGLGWGEWADEKMGQLSGAVGGLQDALARQTMGQGSALELGGALLGTGLTAADSLLDSTSPSRWATDQLLNVASGMQAAQDSMNTMPVGLEGTDTLGTVLGSAYETIMDPKVRDAAMKSTTFNGGDLWKTLKETYFGAQQSYVDALKPTEDQAKTLTPEEIAKNQGRSLLNWADPASVAKTMDALSDQTATVGSLAEKAKQALAAAAQTPDEDARQELMAQAADYGAQAYKLENTSPIALVNENTNLARQMIMELLQPDVTDLAGGLFSALDLTPSARRLTRATGEVIDQDQTVLAKLLDYVVTPENKAAVAAERSSYNPRALYKPSAWWTTGAAQSEIAADKLHRFVTNLMGDVDTVGDAKMLLRQLAQDPAKLISGMAANLFQSEGILARADETGMVRFGNMGLLSNYGAQDTNLMYKALGFTGDKGAPLRIYQQMADNFLENAQSLKNGVLLNKMDFANEFIEGMQKQGYQFFNVADEAGKQQQSLIGAWGHALRKTVSPMYIYTNPGGWATNYISGVLGALGDKAFSLKSATARNEHLAKVFGAVDPTVRGFEGAASAMTAAGQLPGQAGQGIMGTLKKWYGNIDESVGGRVYYSAVTQALQKTGKDVLQNAMAPIFQQMGIDAQRAAPIVNHLFETGYSGGNMIEEFNKLVTGQARVFSLSDVNAGWLDALPADSLSEFYDIIRKAPDAPTAQASLTAWADKASAYWDNLIQQSPVVPARHTWMKQEVAQDTADLAQAGKMAEKYAGVPAQQVTEWKKATTAAMQDTQARMEALMNVVTESANPQNRYMLYNVWGQVTDMTADVRNKLGVLAERAGMMPVQQRGQAWANYWTEAQKLWTTRNESVNTLLETAASAVAKGEDFTPQLGAWDILERTARVNEQKLWDTLRLEPGAASYDRRLAQVIDAGRQLTDKAVARTYAAARRFASGTDAMDYIISAERNAQMAGAQARAYLDEVLESALQSGKWEDYYSIRNETWRQLRQYEQQVWGIAERNIVRDGLGAEKATGLKFNAGPDGIVELVAPTKSTGQRTSMLGAQKEVTQQEYTSWLVRREDGTTTSVPDNMVPADLKRKYDGVTDDDVEAAVEMELDNIASAHPFAEDAQKILDETKPTAAEEVVTPLDEVTGPVTPEVATTAVQPTATSGPTLLQQVRDRLIADGLVDETQAANVAKDLVDEAGNDAAKLTETYAQYKRMMAPAGATATGDLPARVTDVISQLPRGNRVPFTDITKNFTDKEWPLVYQELRKMQDDGQIALISLRGEKGKTSGGVLDPELWKYTRTVAGGDVPTAIDWANLDDYRMGLYVKTEAQFAKPAATAATVADEVTPFVAPSMVADAPGPGPSARTLQTLRDAARQAGLPTANANGSPLDLPAWNAVKKYFAQNNLPLQAQKLTDLAGDELNQAIKFLQERAGVTKASDMYRAEAAGATAGAKDLAALWDADATATLGLPSMESMAKQYKDGQRTFEFEDLYGRTVAGKRIENSNDVLRLVEQYIGLRSDVAKAQETVKATQKYAKLSKAEILRAERDNLLKWGYSTEEINSATRNDILRFIEIATQKDLPDPNMIFFEGGIVPGLGQLVEQVRKALNLGNGAQVGDLNKMADMTIRNTTAAGGMYAPDLAYAAQHARDQIANILQYVNGNLDNIMAPKGAIAEGQALRAVNDFRRQVLPAWDNAKAVAGEYGNRMRSFTMIDFSNNTRLDEVAALFFPYSFWSTRAMKNSRERMIFEPQIWRRMMQSHNYMNRMADQRGDPDRYDGMMPVDLGNGTTYYLRIDPTKYWPTLGLFMQNDYADPESANNAFSFGLESVRSSGFNPYPWFDAAGKAITNLKEGKPIAQDMSLVDYVPAGKPLAWMAARMMGPNLPQAVQPGYFEYNIGRELTTMVTEGSITADQAQYAQELLRMMRSGESLLPEMQGQQEALNQILRTATERAANKELLSSATSWGTGVQVKPFDQDERQAMQASQTYQARQYGPTNPYGSEMAQNATFDQYPELRPRFSQSAILNEDMTRPGASAAKGQRIDETTAARDGLYGAGDAAVDAYLKQNPMATKKEIAAARTQAIIQNAGQYVDQAALDAYLKANPTAYYSEVVKFVTDTIAQKYPSADLVEASGKPKDYNPLEQKWNFQEGVLKQAAEKFPYPTYPEGGSQEQIAAYMKQKEAIDQQRKQWQMAALTSGTTGGAQLVTAGAEGWQPWNSGYGVDATTAGQLVEDNKYKYATDAEKQRLQEIEQYGNIDPRTGFNKWGYDANGAYNAQYDTVGGKRTGGGGSGNYREAYNNVAGRFSKEEVAVWEGYYKLPKGEAREQYKRDNPGFKFLNLYAYNKFEIEAGMAEVGVDGALAWSRIPAYDGTPENKAQRDAYFDANPKAFLFQSWLNGRPANYDETKQEGETPKYNFGADYATAKEMFGANIWDIVGGYKRGWDKAQTSAYFKANPQLSGFFDWWYGNEKKSTGSYGRGAGGFGGGYAKYEPKEKDIKGFNPAYMQPYVKPDEMDNYLMPRENYINKWQPQNANTAWLNAGQRLAPDRLSKWTPGSKKSNG